MGEIHRPPEGFVALTMAKPLRLGGVPEHFSLPIQLSMKKGLVGSEEVTFDAQPGGTGQMIENLNNGSLDVAFALTEGMVMATTSGALKGCSIVGVYVESPLEWGVHVHPASTATCVADLDPEKQNRVAISRFMSGSHLMSYAFTKQNDWPAEKLQFVPTGGLRGALEAFKDDKVDLFLWDQFMTTPCVEDGTLKKVGVVPSPWPCFVVVAGGGARGEGPPGRIGADADARVQSERVHRAAVAGEHPLCRAGHGAVRSGARDHSEIHSSVVVVK